MRFDGVRFAVFNAANEPAFRDDSVYSLLTAPRRHAVGGHRGRRAGPLSRGRVPRVRRGRGPDQPLRARRVRRSGRPAVGRDRRAACFDCEGDALQPRRRPRRRAGDERPRDLPGSRRAACSSAESGLLVLHGGRARPLPLDREPGRQQHPHHSRDRATARVWIGTISGLRRLEGGVRGNPFALPRIVDGTNISVLHESRSGELWIGTYGRGLMRLDDGPARHAVGAGVAAARQRAGRLRRRRRQRLGRHAGRAAASAAGARPAPSPRATARRLSINTIYEDPRGPLLVDGAERPALPGLGSDARARAAAGGLSRAASSATSSATASDGCGSAPTGRASRASTARRSCRYTMKDGLVNDFVRAFCEDREGGIWIGTDGGLSYWRGRGSFRNFTVGDRSRLRQHPRPAAGSRRQRSGWPPTAA